MAEVHYSIIHVTFVFLPFPDIAGVVNRFHVGCLTVRGGRFSPQKLAIVRRGANRRAGYRLSRV